MPTLTALLGKPPSPSQIFDFLKIPVLQLGNVTGLQLPNLTIPTFSNITSPNISNITIPNITNIQDNVVDIAQDVGNQAQNIAGDVVDLATGGIFDDFNPAKIIEKILKFAKTLVDQAESRILGNAKTLATDTVANNTKSVIKQVIAPIFNDIIETISKVFGTIAVHAFKLLVEPIFQLANRIFQLIFGTIFQLAPSLAMLPVLGIGALLSPFFLLILAGSYFLSMFFGPWIFIIPLGAIIIMPIVAYYMFTYVLKTVKNIDYKKEIVNIIENSPDILVDIVQVVQDVVKEAFNEFEKLF